MYKVEQDKTSWFLFILLLTFMVICVVGIVALQITEAKVPGDLNNDNVVNNKDLVILAEHWMQREPDFLIKIRLYEGRKDLTMKEKQMLFVARKKYVIYLRNDGHEF